MLHSIGHLFFLSLLLYISIFFLLHLKLETNDSPMLNKMYWLQYLWTVNTELLLRLSHILALFEIIHHSYFFVFVYAGKNMMRHKSKLIALSSYFKGKILFLNHNAIEWIFLIKYPGFLLVEFNMDWILKMSLLCCLEVDEKFMWLVLVLKVISSFRLQQFWIRQRK